jgi:hypothetical protein
MVIAILLFETKSTGGRASFDYKRLYGFTALRLYGFTALRLYGFTALRQKIDPGNRVVKSECRRAVGGWAVEPVVPYCRGWAGSRECCDNGGDD